MTVTEYRQRHPRCRYCKHAPIDIEFGIMFCEAKQKNVLFNALWCKLYEPKGMKRNG